MGALFAGILVVRSEVALTQGTPRGPAMGREAAHARSPGVVRGDNWTCPGSVDTAVKEVRKHDARVPTGVGGAASRIPTMPWMGSTEGSGGDTEIAALLRVDPGASTGLACSEAPPGMAGDAVVSVVSPAVAHRRSKVSGLR